MFMRSMLEIYTFGITYVINSKLQCIIIAYKDHFVVYHESCHVLNWI